MTKKLPELNDFSNLETPAFGLELLRTVVIPELLGDETNAILYWAGKKLARHYPTDPSKLPLFFSQAGFGSLEQIDSKKESCVYSLTSNVIESRIKNDDTSTFSLEAGFLAEQYERFNNCVTEAFVDFKSSKEKRVTILIKWDPKDPIKK